MNFQLNQWVVKNVITMEHATQEMTIEFCVNASNGMPEKIVISI